MSSNYLTPSDLKTILHSKRANIYYLEKCRVQVNGGRVEYVTSEGKESYYWNIPIANTTALMLGMGTSVTQAAMREFAHAGVMVGFCGTDGTPLYSANEVDVDVSWLSPQSEYRPTEYLQQWVSFWFVEDKRLAAAKRFQLIRLTQQEVFPSQELVLDSNSSKSRVLYQVAGIAGIHSQKIGNALRTIDTWHPKVDELGAIAVEPYGSVTSRGVACRQPKEKLDFYTLLDNWVTKGMKPDVEQQHYVMAVLIRGGVFGEKSE